MTCDHCGKKIKQGQGAVRYDGKIFHMPCALASESGEMPPQQSHLGLWGFTTGPTSLSELRKEIKGE